MARFFQGTGCEIVHGIFQNWLTAAHAVRAAKEYDKVRRRAGRQKVASETEELEVADRKGEKVETWVL